MLPWNRQLASRAHCDECRLRNEVRPPDPFHPQLTVVAQQPHCRGGHFALKKLLGRLLERVAAFKCASRPGLYNLAGALRSHRTTLSKPVKPDRLKASATLMFVKCQTDWVNGVDTAVK